MFISNNLRSFQFWRKENFVKHRKVSEYYKTDDLQDILLLLMFLLTTNFVEKSHSNASWNFLYFLKTASMKPEMLLTQNLDVSEKTGKGVIT